MDRNNEKIMKDHIRTIGIDDAAFNRNKAKKSFVFGVIVRGNNLTEGILRTTIDIDGWDATKQISKMILTSKYVPQLKAILLASATIGAFNIINLNELYEVTNIPVIIILSKKPNEANVKLAISKLEKWEERFEILVRNPPIEKLSFVNQAGEKYNKYFQQVGLKNTNKVREIIELTTYTGSIPECLRLADMIGQSFKDYELK